MTLGTLCHSSRECRWVSGHMSQGPALVQFAGLNFMAKNNFGKEFITYYSLGSIIKKKKKKSQGRSPRNLEMGTGDHRGTLLNGLLSGPGSATFLIQPRTTCPGMTLLTVGCVLLHQLSIKKTPLQSLVFRPVCWEHCLNWSSLFPDVPSLWQVGKRIARSGLFVSEPILCIGNSFATMAWIHSRWHNMIVRHILS